jgi:hypothetical protein
MKRMASAVTSAKEYQNQEWPFVSVPAFEVVGQSVRIQTGFEVLFFCPMVTLPNVEAWQTFSTENSAHWLEESRNIAITATARAEYTKSETTLLATDTFVGKATPMILDLTANVDEISHGAPINVTPSIQVHPDGPFFPNWMQTPAPLTSVALNVNMMSISKTAQGLLSAALATRRGVFSNVSDISSIAQTTIKFEDHERYHASLGNFVSNSTTSAFLHPHAPFLYPLFANASDNASQLVAAFVALAPIDRYLINLLPNGIRGIDAVVRNCDRNFTYRLDGNSVCMMFQIF